MNEQHWERAQAALDARRDPLRDVTLADSPVGELRELLALRAVLGTLERPRRRRRAALLAAAAALLVALGVGLALRGGEARTDEPLAGAAAEEIPAEAKPPAPRPAGRVLFLSMTTTTRAPLETRVVRTDGRTLRRELRLAPEARAADSRTGSLLATRVVASVTRPFTP